MASRSDSLPFVADAERALQEAVADAIEEHRRAGKPIVVAHDGTDGAYTDDRARAP